MKCGASVPPPAERAARRRADARAMQSARPLRTTDARGRREVGTAAARSKGPHRRPRGRVAPNLREDVAVTFVVDRALDESAGERGVRACGTAETLGRWDARETRARLQTTGSGDRNRHACAVRCELEEEITFKLVTVDEDGEVVRWSDGEGVRFTPPKRCACAEVRCEWPSDDARFRVSISMTTDMSASENKVETGGAWLAYGNGREDARDGKSVRRDGGAAAATSESADDRADEDADEDDDGDFDDALDASIDRSVDEGDDDC